MAGVVAVPPAGLWGAWSFDPAVVGGLVLAAVAYERGWTALRRLARPPVTGRHAAAFGAGLGLLVVALVSPLDGLDATLLSAHMAQHLILLVAAPPLLLAGRPGLVLPRGLPLTGRRRLVVLSRRLHGPARWARNPLVVLVLVTATMWGWHLPGVYDAALAHPGLHAAEHAAFLGTALLFWRLVVDPAPRRKLGYAPAMLLTFGVMLQGAALGAAIALSPAVLYPAYGAGAAMWHVSALGDQQLAGALMWVPPGGLYLITIVALASRWFADVERRMRHREARLAPAQAP
ncbi:MAG TPA: cytochrome c oxidase assembly protein [Actinomycetota bacterium]|nr:cytochrome c oxidase assembly protein [Actinomycetota bacterium]